VSIARIAIVHGSLSAIATMRRIVGETPEYELVFEASDADTTLGRIASKPVELVLLSLELAAAREGALLRALMTAGSSVLVVSTDHAKEYSKVYTALERGALDVVDAPSIDDAGQPKGVAGFRAKLVSVRRLLVPRPPSVQVTVPRPKASVRPSARVPLLAIGASTGGPNAIAHVLADLPRPIDYAIVVVQHVDPAFSGTVASWIARTSGVSVESAHSGQRPTPGVALIASTSDHLELLANGTLQYTKEPVDNPYRPSVDVFFESVARHWRDNAVGVLLTGMGRDGALGMQAMRTAGFVTIAQDEKTSVVWGMPRAAYEAGAVHELLALDRIGPVAASALGKKRTTIRPRS
jgi:two-component system, chemotaxis family, response regulator WspF